MFSKEISYKIHIFDASLWCNFDKLHYPKKLAQDVNSFNILFCLCIMIFALENIQIKTQKNSTICNSAILKALTS